jgi:hypothetical protein
VQRVYLIEHSITHLIEIGHSAVMGKKPDTMHEGMGILYSRGPNCRSANVSNYTSGVGASGYLLEMLTVIGRPRLLFDVWHAVRVRSHSPAMPMGEASQVTPTLRHESVLSPNQATLDLGRLVGLQSV